MPDLVEYAFVGVSLSDAKCMGGEYSNESRNAIYKSLHSSNYWHLHHYFTLKKHLLNYFAPEMAAIAVAWRRHRRERREHGRRRGFFPTRIDLFGMPEEHFIRTY